MKLSESHRRISIKIPADAPPSRRAMDLVVIFSPCWISMDRSHLNDVCALLIQANAMANNTATFAFSTGPIPPTPLPDLAQLLSARVSSEK